MICSRCGFNNPNDCTFCTNCGNALVQHKRNAYLSDIYENPVADTICCLGSSSLFAFMSIMFAGFVFLRFASTVSSNPGMSGIISGIIGNIFSIIICIGLFNFHRACKARDPYCQMAKSSKLLRVTAIIYAVLYILLDVILVITGIISVLGKDYIISALTDYMPITSYQSTEARVLLYTILIVYGIVIIISTLMAVYYILLSKALKNMMVSFHAGITKFKASAYITVMNWICAVSYFIMTMLSALYGSYLIALCYAFITVFYVIFALTLSKYNRLVSGFSSSNFQNMASVNANDTFDVMTPVLNFYRPDDPENSTSFSAFDPDNVGSSFNKINTDESNTPQNSSDSIYDRHLEQNVFEATQDEHSE